MPNDSQETEAGPSNVGVVFRISGRISDGPAQGEREVRILRPDFVKRWSVRLRELMDGNGPNQEILIKLDPDSDVDCASVAFVLEHYQRRKDVKPDPKTLARNCAVLWKYECIPDSFKDLGESMQPRSTSGSLSSTDPQSSTAPSALNSPNGSWRCWQRRRNNTCRELIIIAIVLGLEKMLENEIETAVWGTSKKMDIAALLGIEFDFEGIRKIELGKLFDKVCEEIFEIHGENEKQAKSIQETLKQYKLGNFSKSWEKSAKDFEKWTPYYFLRAMENALTPPEPKTPRRESRAPGGPKELPDVNWAIAIRKTTKAMKDTLHINGNKTVGDQERKDAIIKSLIDLIDKRREEVAKLAAELMAQRDSIVQGWREKLLG